jgi:tRNA(Ile)-lysidine synthase TilS/MesJ
MNKIKLESKVIDFIQRHRLISPGEIVVVGVSGGADRLAFPLLLVSRMWLPTELKEIALSRKLPGNYAMLFLPG